MYYNINIIGYAIPHNTTMRVGNELQLTGRPAIIYCVEENEEEGESN